MTLITFFLEIQWDRQNGEIRISSFESTLRKDQDGLLLQLLLGNIGDLNFYSDGLRAKFPAMEFCLEITPPALGLKDACHSGYLARARAMALFGNRKYLVRYSSLDKSGLEIVKDLLRTPLIYSSVLAALVIALFLKFRIRSLFTRPLIQLRRSISDVTRGHRRLTAAVRKGVLEWKEIDESLDELIAYIVRLEKAENEAGQNKIARQVAHDIRSPLSMLRIAVHAFTEIPHEKRDLLSNAVDRINEIVDSLETRHLPRVDLEIHRLAPLIESVIQEKQLLLSERRGIVLRFEADHSAREREARIEPALFKRIMSNVINNSVEALSGDAGAVTLRLENDTSDIKLAIIDTGCGIPRTAIERVQGGLSIGKLGGQGLGLSHARAVVESWGGQLILESKVKIGTVLTIVLPIQFMTKRQTESPSKPAWV